MSTQKGDPFEVAIGSLIILFWSIGILVLASLRMTIFINIDQIYITCLSISGFAFTISDFIRILYNDSKEKHKNIFLLLYVISVLVGVSSVIVLPHFNFLKNMDLTLINDVIVLYGLGFILLAIAMRHINTIIKLPLDKSKENSPEPDEIK